MLIASLWHVWLDFVCSKAFEEPLSKRLLRAKVIVVLRVNFIITNVDKGDGAIKQN